MSAAFDAALKNAVGQWVVLLEQKYTYQSVIAGGGTPTNVALSSTGAIAVASSTLPGGFPASSAIDGVQHGNSFGSSGGWAGTLRVFPQTFEVQFAAEQTVNKVVVYSLTDNYETDQTPDDSTICTRYHLLHFEVQGFSVDGVWETLATVRGNNYAKRTVIFDPYTTTRIRLYITQVADLNYARLVELECWTASGASVAATGTMYFSWGDYASQPADTPANVSYKSRILEVPRFTRRINFENPRGARRMSYSDGEVILDNADGGIDALLNAIVDGQPGRWYLGLNTWARSAFEQVATSHADFVDVPKRGTVRVKLRDGRVLLDTSVVGAPLGGDTNNAGKTAPIVLGIHDQVEAFTVDAANLRYRFADARYYYPGVDLTIPASPIFRSAFGARDEGELLTTLSVTDGFTWDAATNTITRTAHGIPNGWVVTVQTAQVISFIVRPGTMPITSPQIKNNFDQLTAPDQYWVINADADTFQLSHARAGAPVDIINGSFTGTMTVIARQYFDYLDGSLVMTVQPVGKITCGCYSADFKSVSGFATNGEFFPFIYQTMAGQSLGTFAGAHSSALASPRLRVYLAERTNIADLLDDIAFSSNCQWGFDRFGNFTYGSILPHAIPGTADMTLTDDDLIKDDKGNTDLRMSRLPPLYRSVSMRYDYRFPALDFVAEGESPGATAALRLPYRIYPRVVTPAGDYLTTPGAYHPTMVDSPEFDTLLHSQVLPAFGSPTIGRWATTCRDKFLPHVETREFTASFAGYAQELWNKVATNMPLATDDGADVDWQVLGISLDVLQLQIGFELVRRRLPDVTEHER